MCYVENSIVEGQIKKRSIYKTFILLLHYKKEIQIKYRTTFCNIFLKPKRWRELYFCIKVKRKFSMCKRMASDSKEKKKYPLSRMNDVIVIEF